MFPQVAVGGSTPIPRNDNVDSKTMDKGISIVAYTIVGARTLGRMSTNMIRRWLAPTERAASTNSRSLIDSTCPRTMRPTDAHEKKAITATEIVKLGPSSETSAIAKTRYGRERTTSMNRDNTLSTGPQKYPAVRPTTTPTTTARPEATKPTSSDILAP